MSSTKTSAQLDREIAEYLANPRLGDPKWEREWAEYAHPRAARCRVTGMPPARTMRTTTKVSVQHATHVAVDKTTREHVVRDGGAGLSKFDLGRCSLTIASREPVPPGASVEVSLTTSATAYRPGQLWVGSPEDWRIDEILIGNQRQLAGPVSAVDFLPTRRPPRSTWAIGTVQTGQRLTMRATNVGAVARQFFAEALCTVALPDDSPKIQPS